MGGTRTALLASARCEAAQFALPSDRFTGLRSWWRANEAGRRSTLRKGQIMLEGSDDHVIVKRHMLLRPETSRRVRFRGTPGGRLAVRAFTARGPGLADPEDPIDDGPIVVGELGPIIADVGLSLTPLLGRSTSSGGAAPDDLRLSNAGSGSLAAASASFETAVGPGLAPTDDDRPDVAEARPGGAPLPSQN